jgi:hypothetical protein
VTLEWKNPDAPDAEKLSFEDVEDQLFCSASELLFSNAITTQCEDLHAVQGGEGADVWLDRLHERVWRADESSSLPV